MITVQHIKDKHSDCVLILSPNSIGEVFSLCGFVNAVKKKYDVKLVFCCQPHHTQIPAVLYGEHFEAVYGVDLMEMRKYAQKYPFFELGLRERIFCFCALPEDRGIFYQHQKMHIGHSFGICFFDLIRLLYGIDPKTPFEFPPQWEIKLKNGLCGRSKRAIIFSANNTCYPPPKLFLEKIIDLLIEQGHEVLVNGAGAYLRTEVRPRYGIKFVDFDILTALRVTAGSDFVLGGINGFHLMNSRLLIATQKKPRYHVIVTNYQCVDWNPLKFIKTRLKNSVDLIDSEFPFPKSEWYREWEIHPEIGEGEAEVVARDVVEGTNVSGLRRF